MFASPNRAIGKHMLYPVSHEKQGHEICLPHRTGRLANICYILPGGLDRSGSHENILNHHKLNFIH
jgi:hypothetical protein